MSGFLYCIDGLKTKPTPEILKSVGLGGEVIANFRPCEVFLNGNPAVVFTLFGKFDKEPHLGFYNEMQTWIQKPNTNLYIGWHLNDKPKPESFLKKDALNGHRVELNDGNSWLIPLARKFQEGCILPTVFKMLNGEDLQEVTVEKYLGLQKIAEKLAFLLPAIFDEEPPEKDLAFIDTKEKIFKVCADILAVNYHLNIFEISVLEIFTSDNQPDILKAVVDAPYIEQLIKEELEKKKGLTEQKDGSKG